VSGASLLVGGTLGFLFGIPRTLQQGEAEPDDDAGAAGKKHLDYRVNTNLEQISDWLTKMLVGVGLTQINAIPGKLDGLATAIGEGMGSAASDKTFALATLVHFLVLGFLFGYLWTRLFLASAFRQADLAALGTLATKVEETKEEMVAFKKQAERDAEAQSLVTQQLNPSPNAEPVSFERLQAAVHGASTHARAQIYNQAWDVRSENWRTNKEKMARTIPVFRALIGSDPSREYHTNHGQLGFALKDQEPPDWQAALDELTKAIELRGKWYEKPTWLFYEFNRAICRVMLDENLKQGQPCDDATKKAIFEDLVAASVPADSVEFLDKHTQLKKWMRINGVKRPQLDREARRLLKE
jgi:hypothetical protein